MLISLQIKSDIELVKNQINALIADKKEVPAELQARLATLLDQYDVAVADEAGRKHEGGKDMTITKKELNAALKKFLRHDSKELDDLLQAYRTQNGIMDAGQTGAAAADGGATIPTELLPLVEVNRQRVDLRPYTSVVAVGSRSGKIPVINYDQAIELKSFDENAAIDQTQKGAFTEVAYNLASKGAIIPVSRELIMDSEADIVSIVTNLFNNVYIKAVAADITKAVTGDSTVAKTTITDVATVATLDAIKAAIINCPLDAGANAITVMNQKTFAKLAVAKDKQDRYLLARDGNNSTIRMIEGRPVVVCENASLADNNIIVGDFSTIYHIARPALEVESSEQAGFTTNSVLVRAICRFQDVPVYNACMSILAPTAPTAG